MGFLVVIYFETVHFWILVYSLKITIEDITVLKVVKYE